MARWLCSAHALCAVLFLVEWSPAAEPVHVTLDNVVDPGPNDSTEPLAADFSLARSIYFLDSAALTWQKDRKCFTCHTNYAFLYARPLVSADGAAHDSVRQFAEELVAQRWKDQGPRWDAEVVATAAALAFNDAHTTGELHPLTRQAQDKMWDLQREDGGWNWIKCDWPPMESDDDYGVSVAAIARGGGRAGRLRGDRGGAEGDGAAASVSRQSPAADAASSRDAAVGSELHSGLDDGGTETGVYRRIARPAEGQRRLGPGDAR
jgi:hypothetical protein